MLTGRRSSSLESQRHLSQGRGKSQESLKHIDDSVVVQSPHEIINSRDEIDTSIVKVHSVKPITEQDINEQLKKDTLSFIASFTQKGKSTSASSGMNERALSVVDQYKNSQKLLTAQSKSNFLQNNLKTLEPKPVTIFQDGTVEEKQCEEPRILKRLNET